MLDYLVEQLFFLPVAGHQQGRAPTEVSLIDVRAMRQEKIYDLQTEFLVFD